MFSRTQVQHLREILMVLLVCCRSFIEANSITPALIIIYLVASGAQQQKHSKKNGEDAQVSVDS